MAPRGQAAKVSVSGGNQSAGQKRKVAAASASSVAGDKKGSRSQKKARVASVASSLGGKEVAKQSEATEAEVLRATGRDEDDDDEDEPEKVEGQGDPEAPPLKGENGAFCICKACKETSLGRFDEYLVVTSMAH